MIILDDEQFKHLHRQARLRALARIAPTTLVVYAALFLAVTASLWFLWPLVIPDVFPGMVTTGLLPAMLTFTQAGRLTALILVITSSRLR